MPNDSADGGATVADAARKRAYGHSGERKESITVSSRSGFPIALWLPRYTASWLRPDFVAGLTLAAYAIPVSLAYASLPECPRKPVCIAI